MRLSLQDCKFVLKIICKNNASLSTECIGLVKFGLYICTLGMGVGVRLRYVNFTLRYVFLFFIIFAKNNFQAEMSVLANICLIFALLCLYF